MTTNAYVDFSKQKYLDIDVVFKAAYKPPKKPKQNYYRITIERGDGKACDHQEAVVALTACAHRLYHAGHEPQ